LKKFHLVYRTALNAIPHISELMVDDLRSAIEHAETIVIGNAGEEFVDIMKLTDSDQIVVDLVRVVSAGVEEQGYHGICR
jgi:predicted  nucleic acid-binding Zn-ribbon protein